MFTRGLTMLALPRGGSVCRRTIKARRRKRAARTRIADLGSVCLFGCLVVSLFVCISAHLVLQLEKFTVKPGYGQV